MDLTFGRESIWTVVMHSQIKKRRPNISRLCNLPVFLLVALLGFISTGVQGGEYEICVVKTPLNSPYFIPYVESVNPCNGCSYPDSANSHHHHHSDIIDDAVHVIQMENVDDSVLKLDIVYANKVNVSPSSYSIDKKSFVFVITSSEQIPLSIVIHTDLANVTFKFVTRPQDHLYFYGSSSEYSVNSRIWKTPTVALANTRLEYGFISSFTRAEHVNKIVFDLSNEGSKSDDCSIETTEETTLAKCSLVIKKQTAGCFHEHMLGSRDSDIHIIDIENEIGTGNTQNDRKIALHVTDTEDETLRSRIGSPVIRNLTIILRSTLNTLWSLKVSNVQGFINLLVADGGQVENISSPELPISVEKYDLPKSFDLAILHVLNTIGPMVSYTLTDAPSIIQLVVPAKKKSKPTTKQKTITPSWDFIHIGNVKHQLDNLFTYDCYPDNVTLVLPLWIEQGLGGVTMRLRDQSCRSYSNGTHLVLQSKFSVCGFDQANHNNYYLYTNLAILEFGSRQLSLTDDEDFEGSGFEPDANERKITKTIECKSDQKMRHKTKLEILGNSIEYGLQIYRDESFLKRIDNFPVTIPSDSTIYAKVEFTKEPIKAPELKIIIEHCILSSSAQYSTRQVTIIRKSCSHQPYVTVEKSFINTNVAFHFLLSLENIPTRRVYLHCQIGVCSNDPLPQPFLNKCVDPTRYCAKDSLLKAFDTQVTASVINTIVVGPFEVQPVKDLPPQIFGTTSTHRMPPGGKSPIVVMEGLSTEIVVGIAIGSFIIGVCLTATLWIIYLKTDPRRQSRPESVVPRNSAYDLSGHSGSSTPSSQAPMTT